MDSSVTFTPAPEFRVLAVGRMAPLAAVPAMALSSLAIGWQELVAWSAFVVIEALLYAVRIRHIRLVVDTRGLVVVNAWRNHYVPWDEVVRFETGRGATGAWMAHVVTSRRWAIEIHGIVALSRKDWRVADAVSQLSALHERAGATP